MIAIYNVQDTTHIKGHPYKCNEQYGGGGGGSEQRKVTPRNNGKLQTSMRAFGLIIGLIKLKRVNYYIIVSLRKTILRTRELS